MNTGGIKDILKASINSAIGIDDEFVEPYDTGSTEEVRVSTQLYQAFHRDLNCTLSLFRYKDYDDFQSRALPLLKNKDLLLLDWQLRREVPDALEDVVQIIDQAVSQDSPIRLIVIYTSIENLYPLSRDLFAAYYDGKQDVASTFDRIKEKIDNVLIDSQVGLDIDSFEKVVTDNINGYILEKNRKSANSAICKCLPNAIKSNLKEYSEHLIKHLIDFELFHFSNQALSINCPSHQVHILDEDVLLLDNTVVFLVKKRDVEPSQLTELLCSKLTKLLNWRSMLLSLEIKELLSKELTVVGKGLGGIKDSALIHYIKPDDASAAIASIIDCFNAQIGEVLKRLDKSVVTTLWEKDEKEPEPTPEELCKLESVLSFNPHHSGEAHRLQTGDVFMTTGLHLSQSDESDESDENDKSDEDEYLMCITQSCDCLRPRKVYFNIAFAIGKRTSLKNGLEKAQNDLLSFVDDKLVIRWENRFLTVYIPEERLDFTDSINCLITGRDDNGKVVDKPSSLHFLGHQKEVYAQRVINAVFSHAMRIGIGLPLLTNSE